MTKLIDEGKIRYWGVCNYTKEQLDELLETCRVTGAIEPVTYQQYHNMADRQFESDIKDAKAKGLATLAFSPLMRGVITSEYATGLYGQQRAMYERSMMTNVPMPEADKKAYIQACKLLEVHNIAKDQGYSLQQLAIAWSLGNPNIDVILLGAYNKKHLDELMRVSSGELNNDLQEKADALAGKLIIK
jgi:1-deoxyxylulose-5-phosphate synthase